MHTNIKKSDLILFESVLKESLASAINFTAYSLYFPKEVPPALYRGDQVAPRVEKDRILLPLMHQGRFLGVFVAKGTDPEHMQGLVDILPGIVSLCLDKVLLHKQSCIDSLTDLYNQEKFLEIIKNAVEDILSSLTLGPAASMDSGLNQYTTTFSVMLFNLDRFKRVNDTFGYAFGDDILAKIATLLQEELPEQAAAARLENDTLAVFWPQAAPGKCRELAENLRDKVADQVFEYQVSGEKITLSACLGWALFPQDIKGPQFKKPAYELAQLICQKAREAMNVAKENGPGQTYAFGQILDQGGVVLEVLPLNRLVLNLGKSMDAAEGQKFMVWSPKAIGHSQHRHKVGASLSEHYPALHKGEIAIQEVQERISIAEVLYLNDPAWTIEAGDKLSLLAEKDSFLEKQGLVSKSIQPRDLLTGLYSYRDFLALWTKSRSKDSSFSMAMLNLEDTDEKRRTPDVEGANLVLEITKTMSRYFPQNVVSGRYSSNCLIFYFPDSGNTDLHRLWQEILEELKSALDVSASVGLAYFPCLNYAKVDTLENCRKALEHARLISHPRLACFDSLTLTVSADTLFTQGEIFAALEEYKQALAADENNALARNSLAICYARLGKLELARQHFQEITSREQDNLMAWYNLGCVCLKQGDLQEAKELFSGCLDIDPGHAFSLLRLGQLAENNQEFERAQKYYYSAGNTFEGAKLAPRHLARLNWKQGLMEQSQEYLHQALLHDPRDAFSLNLMARIYLESGDDPQIAESLARQSVALRPDVNEFWQDLASIFKIQGKKEQEAHARARFQG